MKKILVYITVIVLLSSCYYDKEETLYGLTCDTAAVSYNASIVPVLTSNCISCHGGAFPSSSIRLDNYTNVRAMAVSGRLLGAVSHADGYIPMPQNATKLSDCTITRFRIWINSGAPNN
jgi:hypothetical protein